MNKETQVEFNSIALTVAQVMDANERCLSGDLGLCFKCPLVRLTTECDYILPGLSAEALKKALTEE